MPGSKQRDFDEYIRMRWAEGARATVIARELTDRAQPGVSPPSLKTIRRRFADFEKVPDETRQEWRRFEWPDAMVAGVLSWEASRVVLDYIHWRARDDRERPTVRLCKWIHRLRLAEPDLDFADAEPIAVHLATVEFARDAGLPADMRLPGLTEQLARRGPWPWRNMASAGQAAIEVIEERFRQQLGAETGGQVGAYVRQAQDDVRRLSADQEGQSDE